MIPVVWHTLGESNRGFWDEGVLERLFDHSMWRTARSFEFEHFTGFGALPQDATGAIVVVPARWFLEQVASINEGIERLSWALVVLCGDEEGLFPWRELKHPNLRVWIQTPHPGVHADADLRFGDFWPPQAPELLERHDVPDKAGWFFAGQINTPNRKACLDVLADRAMGHGDGRFVATSTFGSGMAYNEYLEQLATSIFAPCPGGSQTPDTFRLFEALEAGCIPIVEQNGYWEYLFGEKPPFVQIDTWDVFSSVIEDLTPNWKERANTISAWWQAEKRELAYALEDRLATLTKTARTPDPVTVIITTSPIASHPSTAIIEETVESIRRHEALKDAEIIIAIDGVRPEQVDYRENYAEYVRRLLWICEHRWHNVLPILSESYVHQANLMRAALDEVNTPVVLFVEHDTPLLDREIDIKGICFLIVSGEANVVRLHHETRVLPEHEHLMVDRTHDMLFGVPILRTAQWSQRPHFASTRFYREIIDVYFAPESRTMIEDVIYGAVNQAWREQNVLGWKKWRLFMYAPPGDMKRSTHLDGRAGDPKYPMKFSYNGPVPEGAPMP